MRGERWEVVVRHVDISWIVDHPLLLKLSFHNTNMLVTIGTKWNITSKHDNNSERIVMNLYDTHKSVSSMCNTNMYGRFNLQNTCHIFCSIFLKLPVFKVILHQFWVKKIFPWKFKLELLSYSCMFQVEICSHQLEICKSVCMFIVLAIIVETD